MSLRNSLLILLLSCTAATACNEQRAAGPDPDPEDPENPENPVEPAVLIGAGDIANCSRTADENTASMLDGMEGIIFTAGDNLNDEGGGATYMDCYEPSWGRHLDRTHAVIGNQDYELGPADAYFSYFGEAAGPSTDAFYSFDAGAWHIVVLNSNPSFVPTAAGSPQEQWLREDLATNEAACTMAIFHHPRFYHGPWGRNADVLPFWNALYEAGADVVVNAHFQLYERHARQTPQGDPDPEAGIRQFTVGTGGGGGPDVLHDPWPNTEVRDNTSFGVIKFTLEADSYSWQFIPVNEGGFTDSGSESCH
jgi:hypothetical protein